MSRDRVRVVTHADRRLADLGFSYERRQRRADHAAHRLVAESASSRAYLACLGRVGCRVGSIAHARRVRVREELEPARP
jgi:hypothetical protein